jgi:ribonuclease VapC
LIVDSSAIVAIAFGEPEQVRLIRALAKADVVRIPAPIWFETSIVLSARLGPRVDVFLDGLARQFNVQFVPFDLDHARAAFAAWQNFGRGNSPAKLNFGDCISYATASIAREPLLFVGSDFTQTDVETA